jgi:hypothetical protein
VRGQQPAEAVPGRLGSGNRMKRREMGAFYPKMHRRLAYKLPTGLLPARHSSKTSPANRWIGLGENAMPDRLLERAKRKFVTVPTMNPLPEANAEAHEQSTTASGNTTRPDTFRRSSDQGAVARLAGQGDNGPAESTTFRAGIKELLAPFWGNRWKFQKSCRTAQDHAPLSGREPLKILQRHP